MQALSVTSSTSTVPGVVRGLQCTTASATLLRQFPIREQSHSKCIACWQRGQGTTSRNCTSPATTMKTLLYSSRTSSGSGGKNHPHDRKHRRSKTSSMLANRSTACQKIDWQCMSTVTRSASSNMAVDDI